MQPTIWPMLTRVVSRASVDVTVQHSKTLLIVGSGTVWKWSYTHTESHGPASAALATAVMASYCWIGSAISTRSIFQPCGTNTPKRTLIPATYLILVGGTSRRRGPTAGSGCAAGRGIVPAGVVIVIR